ncbi:MAG: hypothetical protein JKX97_07965 [Candidatus Lindowbacteria bacterium]|nr:hypothetical protein [Candidatus Lindowbacteria bacterium]
MNSSRKIARTLTAFIVVCISVSIFDTGAHSAAPGSSSVQALRTGVGARPAALGNAYVGVTGDLYTMNWNPAGISFLTATEAAASHSSLIADVSHTYAAVGVPVGSLVFGLSINYIDYGSAGQRFEIAGVNPTAIGGTLEPSAAVVSGTLAKKFTEQFAAGVNLKAVNVDLVDQSSTAVAFDAGAVYSFSSQFTL